MNIFFSGIGGVGIGPLAEIAYDAGYHIQGSDINESTIVHELRARAIPISIGQDGTFLQQRHDMQQIDWFVYTSALPADHPELVLARTLGIRIAKRDELLAYIIKEKHLKLIAVAGTHGKTTTTGMAVWTLQRLGIPVSYSVGATFSFGPSGKYDPASEYFIYECDEFDRNFLHFSPYISLIVSLDYDHSDTYSTKADYVAAFGQFIAQSNMTIMWQIDTLDNLTLPKNAWILNEDEVIDLRLAGVHNRRNATLVAKAIEYLDIDLDKKAVGVLERFPGTDRRFERIADNLYSDYGHHPAEIAATLQLAHELSDHIVLVYQPHQNVRQHEIRTQYTDCFNLAEQLYWVPTYLSREDPTLSVLTPDELAEHMTNREIMQTAQLDDALWKVIEEARMDGKLVLIMGAGDIDKWLHLKLAASL